MYVELSKNAELFYKALEDLWCAEKTYTGSPNNATWSCCQAVEKTMKGLLNCYGLNDENTHDLNDLLEGIEKKHDLSEEAVRNIQSLAMYTQRLRYKNMKSDPTSEDAAINIKRTRQVMDEFADIGKCALEFQEAKEVHSKVLSV